MSKAFTLIELIIVIVLIGILAATALPRFVDFSDDAKLNTQKADRAAFISAINLFHLKWQLSKPAAGQSIDGITTNATGYPIGIDGGSVLNSTADCVALFNALVPGISLAIGVPEGSNGLPQQHAITTTGYATFWWDWGNDHCYYHPTPVSKGDTVIRFHYNAVTGEVTEEVYTYPS